MMRRHRIVAAVLAAAGVVAASSAGFALTAAAAAPVKIGISLSLTGDYSGIGIGELQGYKLWQTYVNHHGGLLGRQVQLVVTDDGSDPNTTVSNYQNFITRDHTNLVFGPPTTLLSAPAGLVAQRYGYLFPTAASGSSLILKEKLHNFFLVQPAGPLQTGTNWINYILSLPKAERPKTVAYVALQDPFLTPATALVRAALQKAGIKTVYDQVYGTEDQEMQPIVAAIAASHADMVVGGTQEDDCFDMVKAMVAEHYNPKYLFFMNGPGYPVLFPKNVGKANTDGIFTALSWWPQEKTYQQSTFEAAYLKKYGGSKANISPDAVEAYSVGQLISEAVKKTHSLSNAKLIAAIHKGTWQTLQGPLTFGQNGLAKQGLVLDEWINHTLQPVFPKRIALHAPEIPKQAWGSGA